MNKTKSSNAKKIFLNALLVIPVLLVLDYLFIKLSSITHVFFDSKMTDEPWPSFIDVVVLFGGLLLHAVVLLLIAVSSILIIMYLVGRGSYPLLKRIDRDDVIVSTDGKRVLSLIKEDLVLFKSEFNNLFGKEAQIKTIPRVTMPSLSMKAHPITDNPKVRDLSYEITFQLKKGVGTGSKEELQRLRDFFGEDWTSIKLPDLIKSALYDLNEEKSKVMANFYNPLMESQQIEFYRLVNEKLQPVLKDTPFDVKDIRFSLN